MHKNYKYVTIISYFLFVQILYIFPVVNRCARFFPWKHAPEFFYLMPHDRCYVVFLFSKPGAQSGDDAAQWHPCGCRWYSRRLDSADPPFDRGSISLYNTARQKDVAYCGGRFFVYPLRLIFTDLSCYGLCYAPPKAQFNILICAFNRAFCEFNLHI